MSLKISRWALWLSGYSDRLEIYFLREQEFESLRRRFLLLPLEGIVRDYFFGCCTEYRLTDVGIWLEEGFVWDCG